MILVFIINRVGCGFLFIEQSFLFIVAMVTSRNYWPRSPVAEMTGEMSLLKYFGPTDQSTAAVTESNLDTDSIKSVHPQCASTVLDPQLSSESASIIAESGSENNPFITLPVESHTKKYSYMPRTIPVLIIKVIR